MRDEQTGSSVLDTLAKVGVQTRAEQVWQLRPDGCAHWVQACSRDRSQSSFNNFRADCFNFVLSTVQLMGRVPKGHPLHIGPQLAMRAVDFIGVLNQNTDVDVPRLLPIDEDTLILKWSKAGIDRSLTITLEDIDLVEKKPSGGFRCEHDLGADGEIDYAQLFLALDQSVAHSTSAEAKNAREL